MKRLLSAVVLVALAACRGAESGTDTASIQTDTAVTESAAASGTSDTAATAATTDTSATGSTSTDTAATTTAPLDKPATNQEKSMSDAKIAELHTTAGEIDIRFFPDVAPNHVRNFITLAEQGFYNGTKFHRVIPGFMIQGGDPNTKNGDPSTWGIGGAPTRLKAEFNSVKHKRGIVSMARAQDPNSASSQFFIMVADYPSLDGQYSVFGQVVRGMEVADKIVSAQRGVNDRPINPTTIEKVVIRDARPDEIGPTPK